MKGEIQIFQSHWWQLNSVLCHDQFTTLIWDPAYDQNELDQIINRASQLEASSEYILFTHGDYDHIAGSSAFTDYQRIGSSAMDAKSDKQQTMLQIESLDSEFYIERAHPVSFPELDIKVEPGNPGLLQLGNLEVHFYAAPGHTADGLFSLVPDLGLWVAGDYLSDIEFPFVEDRLSAYLDTLNTCRRIMKDYKIDILVPGHGKPAYTRKDIQTRIDRSEEYLISLGRQPVPDWRASWGDSPFQIFLDKMHQKNIAYAGSQIL